MTKGMNWGRVAKEAQLQRHGFESVVVGLPLPESKKKQSGKPKKSNPPQAFGSRRPNSLDLALESYVHAVAWSDLRKLPPPIVPANLRSTLGSDHRALEKVRKTSGYRSVKRKLERRQLAEVQQSKPEPGTPPVSKVVRRREQRLEKYRSELDLLQRGCEPSGGKTLFPDGKEARIAELHNLIDRLVHLQSELSSRPR